MPLESCAAAGTDTPNELAPVVHKYVEDDMLVVESNRIELD